MMKFLTGNEWYWRLLRTIVQGIIGFFIANVDTIINHLNFSDWIKPLIVALVMAILSPIMAEIGQYQQTMHQLKELETEDSETKE